MSAMSSDLPRPCDSPGHDSQGPSDPNSTGAYLSQKSARYSDVGVDLIEDHDICVMAVGGKLLYVLPGFDVLAVELCHVQVKGSLKTGKPKDTFDLFVRNDFSMSRTYPGELSLKEVTVI